MLPHRHDPEVSSADRHEVSLVDPDVLPTTLTGAGDDGLRRVPLQARQRRLGQGGFLAKYFLIPEKIAWSILSW